MIQGQAAYGMDDGGMLDSFTDVRDLQRELKAQGVEFVSEADGATTGREALSWWIRTATRCSWISTSD